MTREFKIFYSWQSDLPGKDTRNFISDAIGAAVKFLANTVTVIPDRDTQDETGSPNIEQTIFNKINDCDLFVADISIVGSYTDKDGKTKYTPNPNVLLELGYAVKVLGWENVICFVNTDFGKEGDLPFDLNHHRVAGYSLKNMERADVRKMLRDIISSTVMTLMENGLRPKAGFASHIVGTYDFDMKIITEKLIPFDIQNSDFAVDYKEFLLEEIKKKIDKVISIRLPYSAEAVVKDGKSINSADDSDRHDLKGYKISSKQIISCFDFQKERIPDKDQAGLRVNAKKYFDIDLDEEFFNLGDLKVQSITLAGMEFQYRGSDEAKNKYRFIQDCISQFAKLSLFEKYLKTFDGLLFFPLAVWNKTTITDGDINISVVIDEDTAEVIIPDDKLIAEDIAEMAGLVYEEHFPEMLLKMPDTSDIVDGSDYEPQTSAELRAHIANISGPFGYSQGPKYDIDDYVDEIEKYIASPIESSYNEFDFHIIKLRPNEKNWLGKGILLKPKANTIVMSYKVISDHSDGSLEGIMKYEAE